MLAVDCEYPKTPNVNDDSLDVRLRSPNLSVVFIVKSLTLAANNPFFPLALARTSVVKLSYPIPEFITIVSVMTPLFMTGLTIAPDPFPVVIILISGKELY